MGSEDFLVKNFKDTLNKVAVERGLNISEEIINYIAEVLSLYYKGIPLYLIDVVKTTPFQIYKTKGDVSLLLVGLFSEWINRSNRPLTEKDYIKAGKQNYYNAYMYLSLHFNDIKFEFPEELKFRVKNVISKIDLFKEISENFEIYTAFLKDYREENRKIGQIFDIFNEFREYHLRKIFENM